MLVSDFASAFIFYLKELWLSLLIGFLLSGILFELIPENMVGKYFGQKGFKPILLSSAIGVILPVCCFGSLPIAVTMQRKGARFGPVLAFLVATPATSVSALIVCWKLLGPLFTVYIFFAAIVMGLVIGMIGNTITIKGSKDDSESCSCCQGRHNAAHAHQKTLNEKCKGVFLYAFVRLPKEIGLELIIGVAVASFIVVFQPIENVIHRYLTGGWGYLFSLTVGLATYVCSTASVPMADALTKSGLTLGPGMVYLLVGPITSYGTMFVFKKQFGLNVLIIYLCAVCVLSLMLGVGFDWLATNSRF